MIFYSSITFTNVIKRGSEETKEIYERQMIEILPTWSAFTSLYCTEKVSKKSVTVSNS